MKCIKCGHVMEEAAPRDLVAEVRGESMDVQVIAPQCQHCGRVVLKQQGASYVQPCWRGCVPPCPRFAYHV